MYIPTQRHLRDSLESPSLISINPVDHHPESELYYLGARSTEPATQQQASFNAPSAFIGVSVAALIFAFLVIA